MKPKDISFNKKIACPDSAALLNYYPAVLIPYGIAFNWPNMLMMNWHAPFLRQLRPVEINSENLRCLCYLIPGAVEFVINVVGNGFANIRHAFDGNILLSRQRDRFSPSCREENGHGLR